MRDSGLGIDIGTTSVKAIITDREGGILFESSRGHDLISHRAGYAEEDTRDWNRSVFSLLSEIAQKFDTSRLAGVCFSGMVPTMIFLDADGRPLHNSVQQNDARAVLEIDEWKGRLDEDEYFRRTGNTVNQQVLFPKITWFRKNRPEILENATSLVGSYNYGAYLLTGRLGVDTNWALESGMWLIREKKWDTEIVRAAGIPEGLLPPVHESRDVIGHTTEAVRSLTGFPAGIPVMAGIADHVASAFSTGVRDEGDLLLKIGGAGDILYAAKSLSLNKKLFIDYHPVEGTYLLNGCMASSGSIVKWLMEIMGLKDFDAVTPEAAKLPPGSDGLVLLPYFLGEKTPIFDVKARGVFFGLNLSHTRAHMFRAVLEAVAFGFLHHVETLREGGCEIRRVFLSNGGARSPLWKEIVLDVLGSPGVYIADHPGSSMGAALVALNGAGADPRWAALERFLERGNQLGFSPTNHEKYKGYYAIYRKLYDTLKPMFAELADLNREETRRENA